VIILDTNVISELIRATPDPDAQIAAICRELGAVLATRNIKDFEETGVELVDPWQADA
jgi:predicted nucleic acid-binding protein